jgi:hypothetical protein
MKETNWNDVTFDNFKCRCSAINRLLTNSAAGRQITEKQETELKKLEDKETRTGPQEEEMKRLQALKANSGNVSLGVTCIDYLMEVYAWETQGMISLNKESLDTMPLRKGKLGEREAGLLLSVVDGEMYETHKERISNDYLSGEIDFYLGDHIYAARNITDIKNSFDYPIYLKKLHTGLESGQTEQLQGYGDITTAPELYVANCLVSFTPEMVEDMKWKIMRKTGAVTEESPDFKELWATFKKSMQFDHLNPNLRVNKIKIEPFTEFEQTRLYDRVKYCRDFLNKFHEERKITASL